MPRPVRNQVEGEIRPHAKPSPASNAVPNGREAIDRYRLTRLHSEGGLGRVWLAKDPNIGREVALKELLSHQAKEPRARARFMREAQITGQLEHPNIVPVYELGECSRDGRPFYAMRFVRGTTLHEAIQEEFAQGHGGRSWPRSRQRLLHALCSVGNAIAHAHSRGIVHRDLKPENIILGDFGELILLDWGLAKHLEDEPWEAEASDQPGLVKTHVGAVMGTIAYMSPEQADGQEADERTDIYGLGAILFEILTGRAPHGGESALEVLREIIEQGTPRASSLNPTTPKSLDAICAKAMAKRPGERYSQAKELVEDLERWLSDEPVSVLPDGVIRGLARWIRRHQSWAYSATGALMIVVIAATLAAVRLGAAAERERGLRARSTAELAALAVGREIDLRWYILQTSAADEELRAALLNEDGDDSGLQKWVDRQFDKHQRRTRALSWIVMDRAGIQRARHPFTKKSVGKRFSYRDYFHGQGKDLRVDQGVGIDPITVVHRSSVFRSTVTKNLMVAFSVPIWRTNEQQEVIGVIGMTVELGEFGLEELELDDKQMLVLVDTRPDREEKCGLVLQHDELTRRKLLQDVNSTPIPPTYVPPERLAQFRELFRTAADRPRGRELTSASGLETNYRDPLGGDYRGRWFAAFEPVVVKARAKEASETGFVVIVQERFNER